MTWRDVPLQNCENVLVCVVINRILHGCLKQLFGTCDLCREPYRLFEMDGCVWRGPADRHLPVTLSVCSHAADVHGRLASACGRSVDVVEHFGDAGVKLGDALLRLLYRRALQLSSPYHSLQIHEQMRVLEC